MQTIQNAGNITGTFRSSISRCCTSPLAAAGNSSATTCGAGNDVASIGADVTHSIAPNATFSFAMSIGTGG